MTENGVFFCVFYGMFAMGLPSRFEKKSWKTLRVIHGLNTTQSSLLSGSRSKMLNAALPKWLHDIDTVTGHMMREGVPRTKT